MNAIAYARTQVDDPRTGPRPERHPTRDDDVLRRRGPVHGDRIPLGARCRLEIQFKTGGVQVRVLQSPTDIDLTCRAHLGIQFQAWRHGVNTNHQFRTTASRRGLDVAATVQGSHREPILAVPGSSKTETPHTRMLAIM